MNTFNVICLMVISAVLSSCGALSVLGPTDKPKFEDFEWSHMKIQYHEQYHDRKGEDRVAIITNPEEIRRGFSRLNIRRISPMSFPAQPYITLKTTNFGVWSMNFQSTTHFVISNQEDNYRCYGVDSSDEQFHDWMISVCQKDLAKSGILTKTKNIWIF